MHEIHSERAGDAGPLVVFSHGWGDSSATWDAQVPVLSQRARVVTWDLLGHGQSDAPEDPAEYSRDRALADLEALVGDEPNVVLVGHSFGGQLSLAYALRHPERVSGLGLVATGPGYRDESGRNEWNRGIEAEARRREERGERALAASIRGFVMQHDSSIMDAAPTIAAPTLALVGAKDVRFLNAADWFVSKLPNAWKVVVPDAGHAVMRHQPEPVNAALADLLDRVASASR